MVRVIDLHFLTQKTTIASFLIESTEGLILVETGPYSTFSFLEKGVQEAGYVLEDIKHVLLTYIHLDHAGAAWALAQKGAKIYVHPFGKAHLADPSRLMESARRIYKEDMDRLWGEMQGISEEQLQVVAHGEVFSFGDKKIKAWHTPGHASHHIAWQLDEMVFTGDVAGVKIGKGAVVAPLPPPDISLEKWEDSIELLSQLQASTLYLTHYGAVTEVDTHLDGLRQNIQVQANWIKEHWQAGESMEEMIPKFDKFCQEELRNAGASEEQLVQYQAANPAWMSVAGLVRYWKKKLA